LALKVAKRLLETPPRFVPSGTKLIVTSWGCGQALLEIAYGTTRDSSASSLKRAFGKVGRLDGRNGALFRKKGMGCPLANYQDASVQGGSHGRLVQLPLR